MNRISFLKNIDAILGKVLTRLLPRPSSGALTEPSNILFIRPGGIGDAVLLVPALKALKKKYPAAKIEILAEKRNAAVFHLSEAVANIMRYDVPGEFFAAFSRKYDVVIDTEQWHRLSAIVGRLIKAPVKVGYGTNERRRLFTQAVDYSHECYEAESFFDLLGPLGIEADLADAPWLEVPAAAGEATDHLLGPLVDKPFVVLFPGASIPERQWGAGRFRSVAEWCLGQGLEVVLVGGPQDLAAGEAISEGLDVLNLAGRTSLVETAAVLEKAALLVAGDSGVLHLAVGLDVPTIALFGPGIAAKWAPRGERHIVLNKNLPCSPCTQFGYTPPCPIEAQCLREIGPKEVIDAIQRQLDSPEA